MNDPFQTAPAYSFASSYDGKGQLKCEGRILARVKILGSNNLHFAHFPPEEIRNAWSSYVRITSHNNPVGIESDTEQVELTWVYSGFRRLVGDLEEVSGL